MEKNITGKEGGRRNKMADSNVQPATVLPVAHPSRGKHQGNYRQYSEQEMHRRCGGACMHKTDGKLFCVAAPIPGAGAGEGEWGGGGGP